MQQNTLTEIFAFVLAILLAILAGVLLYLNTISYDGALALWGMAASVFAANLMYKAPSPGQQNQLTAQQQNLQTLFSQVLSVLPGLVQSVAPKPPVAQPQAQQTPLQGKVGPVSKPATVNSAAMTTAIQPTPLQGVPAQQFQNPPSLLPAVNLGTTPIDPWSDSQVTQAVKPQ